MSIFKKKKEEKETIVQRREVEDLLDHDYTCKDISEELGVPVERVYRINEAKKRREERNRNRSSNGYDNELKKLEIEQRRQEIKHDMEMQKLIRAQELKNMFSGGGSEDEGSSEETMLMNLLGMAMQGKTQTPQSTRENPGSEESSITCGKADPGLIVTIDDKEAEQIANNFLRKIPRVWGPVVDRALSYKNGDLLKIVEILRTKREIELK